VNERGPDLARIQRFRAKEAASRVGDTFDAAPLSAWRGRIVSAKILRSDR
jgi:hypothetical protein